MGRIIADRVQELTTTAGTGALTLAGAITGYRAFSSVCTTGDTCHYAIFAVDGQGVPTGAWETGLGTYSGANTLTRTTVHASTNAGAAVSFAAGDKRVMISHTAAAAGGPSPFWAKPPTPPTTADFGALVTGSNVGGTTWANVSRGVQFGGYPTAAGGNAIVLAPLAHPGGSWTMDVLYHTTWRAQDHYNFGLYARNTTSGKICSFSLGFSGSPYILIQQFSDINTFASGHTTTVDAIIMQTPVWLRLAYNSGTSTFAFSHSRDGEQFRFIQNVAPATYLTTFDQVGLWSNNIDGSSSGADRAMKHLIMSASIV